MATSYKREAYRALRDYRRIKKKQTDLTSVSVISSYSGMPSGHKTSRTTENIALQSVLDPREERIIFAVERMIEMQSCYYNKNERIKFVEMVYLDHTHTMEGAAIVCNYSKETLKKWAIEILSAVYAAL